MPKMPEHGRIDGRSILGIVFPVLALRQDKTLRPLIGPVELQQIRRPAPVLFRNLLYFAQGRRQKNRNPRDMGLYHPVIIGGHIRVYPHFLKQAAIMILRSFHRLHFRLVENRSNQLAGAPVGICVQLFRQQEKFLLGPQGLQFPLPGIIHLFSNGAV